MPTKKMLDLSTAHVPARQSDGEPDFGDHRFVAHEYGWIVFYSEPDDDTTPAWLVPILEHAKAEGVSLIDFDADGEEDMQFAIYDDDGVLVFPVEDSAAVAAAGPPGGGAP